MLILNMGLTREGKSDILMVQSLKKQIGGKHYSKFSIQPTEFIYKNDIPFIEGCVIKYVCRWQDKGGVQDLDKAIHFIEMLKELHSDTVQKKEN